VSPRDHAGPRKVSYMAAAGDTSASGLEPPTTLETAPRDVESCVQLEGAQETPQFCEAV